MVAVGNGDHVTIPHQCCHDGLVHIIVHELCGKAIAHAKANIRLGNDEAFLIKVVSQNVPFVGYPRSLNAIDCIEKAGKE